MDATEDARRSFETDPHCFGIIEAVELAKDIEDAERAARRRRLQFSIGVMCLLLIVATSCGLHLPIAQR